MGCDIADVIIGAEEQGYGSVRPELFAYKGVKRQGTDVHTLAKLRFNSLCQGIIGRSAIRKNKQIEPGGLESVIQIQAVELKIRHPVASFNRQLVVAPVVTQRTGSILDSDFREGRENGFPGRFEAVDDTGQTEQDVIPKKLKILVIPYGHGKKLIGCFQ